MVERNPPAIAPSERRIRISLAEALELTVLIARKIPAGIRESRRCGCVRRTDAGDRAARRLAAIATRRRRNALRASAVGSSIALLA
jgi:hypothetical protein